MATQRQKAAIKGVLVDKKSVQRAMLDAGYSPTVAKTAKNLTASNAFIEAMDKLGLSDDDVLRRHNQLMKSDNEQIAMKAVDTAYKVKGKYNHDKRGNTFNAPVLIQITPPNDPQVAKVRDITE